MTLADALILLAFLCGVVGVGLLIGSVITPIAGLGAGLVTAFFAIRKIALSIEDEPKEVADE